MDTTRGGTDASVPPTRRARLSVVRVRELEVRAAARAASLRIAEASEQLEALAKSQGDASVAATAASDLVALLEREVRTLRKLGDPRIEKDADALDDLFQRARTAAAVAQAAVDAGVDASAPAEASSTQVEAADGIVRSVARGGEELVRRAGRVRSGMTNFVRSDGTIDFKGLRAIVSAALDSAGNVWQRLNGRAPRDIEGNSVFAPLLDEDEQFRLRDEISALEREFKTASKERERVIRSEDQIGKLIRSKEIRAMDDMVSAVRRTLAIRVLQLEMERIFVSLAEELERSSVTLVPEQRLLIAEFAELDARLFEMRVFVDNAEPTLVPEDALEEVAADVQYFKTRLGLDASIYTSTRLDWMQVRQMTAVSLRKLKTGLEFYARGFRLFIGDLQYAARLVRRAIGGYTPTPREVRTLRRALRDLVTLIPFTIILIAPITPVGHVFVFSLIQRYWPEFFPSTFSERRQLLMKRYEKYAQSINGDDVVSAQTSSKGGGILSRFLFFWRSADSHDFSKHPSVSTDVAKSNGAAGPDIAGDNVRDQDDQVPPMTDVQTKSNVAANSETDKTREETGRNGIPKSSANGNAQNGSTTLPVANPKGLGIDDLHLAD